MYVPRDRQAPLQELARALVDVRKPAVVVEREEPVVDAFENGFEFTLEVVTLAFESLGL